VVEEADGFGNELIRKSGKPGKKRPQLLERND
jgi:hypothetical protein